MYLYTHAICNRLWSWSDVSSAARCSPSTVMSASSDCAIRLSQESRDISAASAPACVAPLRPREPKASAAAWRTYRVTRCAEKNNNREQ